MPSPKTETPRWEQLLRAKYENTNNAPSAGWSDEPSYTTPAGYPCCELCGYSTRDFEEIVCKPCQNGTRLILTAEDRRWLRKIKISARG